MQRVIIIMISLVITATLSIVALVDKGWSGCVVGQKSCEDDGYYWICETCGSETCWIFTGEKCK
ncbi:MAG: hypothetical protein AB1444_11600 [Spirochaetota bacterium]